MRVGVVGKCPNFYTIENLVLTWCPTVQVSVFSKVHLIVFMKRRDKLQGSQVSALNGDQ